MKLSPADYGNKLKKNLRIELKKLFSPLFSEVLLETSESEVSQAINPTRNVECTLLTVNLDTTKLSIHMIAP